MTTGKFIVVLVLLAVAIWWLPTSARARVPQPSPRTPAAAPNRLPILIALLAACFGWLVSGVVLALIAAVFAGCVSWLLRGRQSATRPGDPLALAAGWDLLAACLRGGLPVPRAIAVIAPELPQRASRAVAATGELLALGASHEHAWAPAREEPDTAELARAATRSARSGAELAVIATELARRCRADAQDRAAASAARATVSVTGPLGLCFLPAFLCLGVVPVVIGLATRVLDGW